MEEWQPKTEMGLGDINEGLELASRIETRVNSGGAQITILSLQRNYATVGFKSKSERNVLYLEDPVIFILSDVYDGRVTVREWLDSLEYHNMDINIYKKKRR